MDESIRQHFETVSRSLWLPADAVAFRYVGKAREKMDAIGPGEWSGEPDRVEWKTKAGLPALILRNGSGAWCGYVAVDSSHRDYQNTHPDVEVHGSVTYTDKCRGAICHVPKPGEPDDVWWIGFDCAHSGDVVPAHGPFSPYDSYKDAHYVVREVESLASQLADRAVS